MFDLLFFDSRLAITSQAKPSQANNIKSVSYKLSKKICLILFKIFYIIKNVNSINKYKILIKFIDSNNKKLLNKFKDYFMKNNFINKNYDYKNMNFWGYFEFYVLMYEY